MELALPAYAKINWTLDVLGRYPAGHEAAGYTKIETVLARIDLHDLVTVRVLGGKSGAVTLEADRADLPQTANNRAAENSAVKAVLALREALPAFPKNDIWIGIEKNIPLAGGLGGSATDGASVLLALNALFELGLLREELVRIASAFGSDSAFFASEYRQALGVERGTDLRELPSLPEPLELVLVNPGRELLAGAAYRSLEEQHFRGMTPEQPTPSARFVGRLEAGASLQELMAEVSNDLEQSPYVQQNFPELFQLREAMLRAGCVAARMSGSGSTVFGVCSTRLRGDDVVSSLRNQFPRFSVFTSTL